MTTELIDIIKQVMKNLTDDSDMAWTHYDIPKQLRNELKLYIQKLQVGDFSSMEKLKLQKFKTTANSSFAKVGLTQQI